jgi:RNA polymerase sigma-70 factor, ECF subfamily
LTATVCDGIFFAVVPAQRKDGLVNRLSAPRTLGDLLYANQSQAAMSEADWVGLVRSVAAGDQLALHSIYEQTHGIVFTLIMRIVNNRETAEELTLDVFHDVWRRASTYEPANGSVVGWIVNQARSRAIDRLRYEQRKKRVDDGTGPAYTKTAANDPLNAFQVDEQTQLLRKALDILNAEEKQAIETAFFSELTYQEAAARLNQPLGTIKSRIRSGLGKLRVALARELEHT